MTSAAAASHGFRIRAIWAADCWNQGSSGILNEWTIENDREFSPTALILYQNLHGSSELD